MNRDEPAARLVRAWASLYTRGLPAHERERRLLELESDLWEHLHDPAERSTPAAVVGRSLRGVPADVRWRYRTLLDSRGARQGSHVMSISIRSGWWALLTAVLGAALVTIALATAVVGTGDSPFAIFGAATAGLSGGLILAGLVRRAHSMVAGSQLIVAGAALTVVGGFEFIPVGVLVAVTGFWTGNLQLSDEPDAPDLHPVSRQQIDLTRSWWVWLVVAAALFAIGWLPLVFDDPDDLTTGGWYTWALSWFGAIVAVGIGVLLAGLRLVVRHRTRPV